MLINNVDIFKNDFCAAINWSQKLEKWYA